MDARTSTAHKAYETIRHKILTFALLPAERINEVNLAEALEISRTPLREALNRLVAEGLLVARERGFSVPDLEPGLVRELFEARIEVESSTVRLACERAKNADLVDLAAFMEESAAESPDASVDRLMEFDCRFHETIAKLSGNRELLRILRNLNDRIHLIRWIGLDGKRDVTQEEHRRILKSIQDRDPASAEHQMREHIMHRNDEILTSIKRAYAHVHTAHFADAI